MTNNRIHFNAGFVLLSNFELFFSVLLKAQLPEKTFRTFFSRFVILYLISNIYASISLARSIFVPDRRYLVCHSFCVEGKHLSQIIFRLRSFRFFAVNFGKRLQKKDKSESTSYLKRMPAFRGIWCLIKFIDLKHEPSSLRFSSAPYHKQSSCIFDYQGIWNNIVLCSHGFFNK